MKNSTWAAIVIGILSTVYITWPDDCAECPAKDKEIVDLKNSLCKANSDTSHKNCLKLTLD